MVNKATKPYSGEHSGYQINTGNHTGNKNRLGLDVRVKCNRKPNSKVDDRAKKRICQQVIECSCFCKSFGHRFIVTLTGVRGKSDYSVYWCESMTVSPKTVLIFLSSLAGVFFGIFMIVALTQANLDAISADPWKVLNIDAEASIPTWYAQSLLLVAAALIFVVAKAAMKDKKYWYVLAGMMLFISIDEGASIHELLITPMRELLNISSGPLYYAWVIVYGLLFVCVGLFFIRFFMRLPRRTRVLFTAALATFLAGALGMEMIGGFVISQALMPWQLYVVIVGVEELLEMLGVALFIYTLLDYIARSKSIPRIRVENKQ